MGRGQNTLEDLLSSVVKDAGREIAFETHPEAGYYYRSDHFNFAKVGVPALVTSSGTRVEGKDEDYGKKIMEAYNSEHYHRPSDEFTNDWNLDGTVEDLKLFYKVGTRVVNGNEWPTWKTGSEFKAVRDKQLQ